MGKKLVLVAGIVVATIGSVLLLTILMPVILSLVGIAKADPSAGNYTGYSAALGACPLWIFSFRWR
jgi:hypothetical protein